jgi:hypothetical protein
VSEAADAKPEKKYLQVTGEGLIEAAKAVAEIASPVIAVVTKILAIFH